jgi:hypothetical protein
VHGGLAQFAHSRAVALPVDCFAFALLCSALLCFALLFFALLCSALLCFRFRLRFRLRFGFDALRCSVYGARLSIGSHAALSASDVRTRR